MNVLAFLLLGISLAGMVFVWHGLIAAIGPRTLRLVVHALPLIYASTFLYFDGFDTKYTWYNAAVGLAFGTYLSLFGYLFVFCLIVTVLAYAVLFGIRIYEGLKNFMTSRNKAST